jgi:hypothetical protein
MDAFEQLAADIFWAEGYWVQNEVKVALTREDKLAIGLPSCPRWEIDLVAYRPASNELLALECKSYLDSGGVHAAHFYPDARLAGRYKLFNKPALREVVLARLRDQMIERGFCPHDVQLRLGLVYAHATPVNEQRLAERFAAEGWLRFGPEWLRARLGAMAAGGYQNSTAAIVAKMLLTPPPQKRRQEAA